MNMLGDGSYIKQDVSFKLKKMSNTSTATMRLDKFFADTMKCILNYACVL